MRGRLGLDRLDIVPLVAEVRCRQDIVPVMERDFRHDIVPSLPSSQDTREGVVAVVDDLAGKGEDDDSLGSDLDDGPDVLVLSLIHI